MELTFPLAPKVGQKVTKLDFATTGPTAGLEVLLTAYDDRVELQAAWSAFSLHMWKNSMDNQQWTHGSTIR
jgi:hypothetical protein